MSTIAIRVEPAASLTVNAPACIQLKSSLSVAGLKATTGCVPHAQVIFVVVPTAAAAATGPTVAAAAATVPTVVAAVLASNRPIRRATASIAHGAGDCRGSEPPAPESGLGASCIVAVTGATAVPAGAAGVAGVAGAAGAGALFIATGTALAGTAGSGAATVAAAVTDAPTARTRSAPREAAVVGS